MYVLVIKPWIRVEGCSVKIRISIVIVEVCESCSVDWLLKVKKEVVFCVNILKGSIGTVIDVNNTLKCHRSVILS